MKEEYQLLRGQAIEISQIQCSILLLACSFSRLRKACEKRFDAETVDMFALRCN